MVQKGQKSPKVDIEPDNSQPTICRCKYMGLHSKVSKSLGGKIHTHRPNSNGGTVISRNISH